MWMSSLRKIPQVFLTFCGSHGNREQCPWYVDISIWVSSKYNYFITDYHFINNFITPGDGSTIRLNIFPIEDQSHISILPPTDLSCVATYRWCLHRIHSSPTRDSGPDLGLRRSRTKSTSTQHGLETKRQQRPTASSHLQSVKKDSTQVPSTHPTSTSRIFVLQIWSRLIVFQRPLLDPNIYRPMETRSINTTKKRRSAIPQSNVLR